MSKLLNSATDGFVVPVDRDDALYAVSGASDTLLVVLGETWAASVSLQLLQTIEMFGLELCEGIIGLVTSTTSLIGNRK